VTPALFEARGLHKRFGAQVVLERIDLAFATGQLHGIMGPNGAGKTTCFNCLTGRYRPDRGQVLFDGRDITGLAPQAIARIGVARSFQHMNLFDRMSALENVALALPEMRARGLAWARPMLPGGDAEDRGMAVLASVGLECRAFRPAGELAYGERRALEIGVALAAEPKILFLDEPTSGLGTEGTARLAELVAELKRRYTLVVIEHDMRFLFGLADRVSVIHWGQVIAEGTPDELRDDPWVRRSELGRAA
jgi:branched-chain amino acid transport system ATP-binding protein